MTEPIIKVEALSYSYPTGEKRALNEISLEIYPGEYIAIMGANGAGKTTFCLHMNGVLPLMLGGKMGGTIHVIGTEPYEHHVYDMAHNVGMVLQDPEAQLFSSDVVSEVAFAAENQGISREEMLKRVSWALETVRMSNHRDSSPNELSGGQKQRLVIAANLVTHPKILILDEPTSQLDPVGADEVFSTLRELNKEYGMTILVATHSTDQIVTYADRVLVLKDGQVIGFDKPRRIFNRHLDLKKAHINVPEVTELDHLVKVWQNSSNPEVKENVQSLEANVTKEEVIQDLAISIKEGKIRPNSNFQLGLGRRVPENIISKTNKTILEVTDVSFRYGKKSSPVIHGINLQVQQGEVVGMIGQNGAGKTTLMKCITGINKPSGGQVKINGLDVTKLDGIERAKIVGLILQNPDNQLFQMTSYDEIAFGLKNLGLPDEEIEQRVNEVLELTSLGNFREVYPFKLSMGDRRKLTVASIYAMHPSLLIFDEPTTGQDYQGRYQLCDLAMRLNQLGTTILMISHDMSLIAKYTQRTLVMGNGSIILDAPTREVFSHREILESTFLEPPPVVQLAQELQPYGVPKNILTIEELFHAITGKSIG